MMALSQLAWAHAHETLIWASRDKRSRHAFNYDLINGPDPAAQVSSVWRIPAVPGTGRLHGHHPAQKPLRLLRRAVVASTMEGELVVDPVCESGTTGVAAKERRFFVGAEMGREFAELAARRVGAARRGVVLRVLPGAAEASSQLHRRSRIEANTNVWSRCHNRRYPTQVRPRQRPAPPRAVGKRYL
jgi:hypothetical protein